MISCVNDFFSETDSEYFTIIAVALILISIFTGVSFMALDFTGIPLFVAMMNDNVIEKLDVEVMNTDTFLFIFSALLLLSIVQLYLMNNVTKKSKEAEMKLV